MFTVGERHDLRVCDYFLCRILLSASPAKHIIVAARVPKGTSGITKNCPTTGGHKQLRKMPFMKLLSFPGSAITLIIMFLGPCTSHLT